MASPSVGRQAENRLERLELDHFEAQDGESFDAVKWLNQRLSRSGVAFDKLEQNLSSLGMSVQLLCQDTSESIEVASNQLVAQMSPLAHDLEQMEAEVERGKQRLTTMVQSLGDVLDSKKRSSLQTLSEIDAAKQRVETAWKALREIHSWDRKVRDCEQMIHAGNLPSVLTQLGGLKDVLEAFRMLPEYSKKEEQLKQLEEALVRATKRKTMIAVEKNTSVDLRVCCQVFVQTKRGADLKSIIDSVFAQLAERILQSGGLRDDAGATEYATAVRTVLEGMGKFLEERWPLLKSLEGPPPTEEAGGSKEITATKEEGDDTLGVGTDVNDVVVSAVQSALGVLSTELEKRLGSNSPASPKSASAPTEDGMPSEEHQRAARAMASLAAYVDGFATVEAVTPIAAGRPVLWSNICSERDGFTGLPWALLHDVVRYVMLQPMRDEAMLLLPPVRSQLPPSEAVLLAESNAQKLFHLPTTWARKAKDAGLARLAAIWLGCVDTVCAEYWQRWNVLVDTFKNTLRAKLPREGAAQPAGGAAATFDATLLGSCLQLHAVLHSGIAERFVAVQGEVLQAALQMRNAEQSAFSVALEQKLHNPAEWCERFASLPAEALKHAHSVVQDDDPTIATGGGRTLPAAAAALAEIERQVKGLVTQCCVQPVQAILAGYHKADEWTKEARTTSEAMVVGSLLPLQCVTSVGEHLFSLVPQLDRQQEGAQNQWLPTILEAVADVTVQKALQIERLTILGAKQVVADLEYVQKVTEALGGAGVESLGEHGAELRAFLEAVRYLLAQWQKQQDCATKGTQYVEELREGPSAHQRKFERMLKGVLGLDRPEPLRR